MNDQDPTQRKQIRKNLHMLFRKSMLWRNDGASLDADMLDYEAVSNEEVVSATLDADKHTLVKFLLPHVIAITRQKNSARYRNEAIQHCIYRCYEKAGYLDRFITDVTQGRRAATADALLNYVGGACWRDGRRYVKRHIKGLPDDIKDKYRLSRDYSEKPDSFNAYLQVLDERLTDYEIAERALVALAQQIPTKVIRTHYGIKAPTLRSWNHRYNSDAISERAFAEGLPRYLDCV